MADRYVVYGSQASYYTGKLEAYLRAKGLAYRLEPFSPSSMRRCARSTGVVQIPQVECPDGSWLVDTTPTIAYLERIHPEPAINPTRPAVRFVALLLEDYADEWLWRPAMHYRWSYPDSARLMSAWLAEHLAEYPGPAVVKKLYWRLRQTLTFVRRDGVNATTRPAVEAAYLETLDALEAIFARRPFVLGQRPTQADFGFFASMYRHFFCDPVSGRIMRERAPAVQEWVARMWNLRPSSFAGARQAEEIADLLQPLLGSVCATYLPYLKANAESFVSGDKRVAYRAQGVDWNEPMKPYRVHCLNQLRKAYGALDSEARIAVVAALGDEGAIAILESRPTPSSPETLPPLPIPPGGTRVPVDSWWRSR